MESFVNIALRRFRFGAGKALQEFGLSLDRLGSRYSYDIAFMQKLSRAQTIHPLFDRKPEVKHAWIAPNALLLGRVLVSPWATIWYNAVLRAEINTIRIGHFSSIGDGTVIHSSVSMPINVPPSVNIGKNVAIGDS
jgi:UDP-3-O-[3-hydroxymyristoyl] glucosamine N-acyltransferase